jgi:hypothetical protein
VARSPAARLSLELVDEERLFRRSRPRAALDDRQVLREDVPSMLESQVEAGRFRAPMRVHLFLSPHLTMPCCRLVA